MRPSDYEANSARLPRPRRGEVGRRAAAMTQADADEGPPRTHRADDPPQAELMVAGHPADAAPVQAEMDAQHRLLAEMRAVLRRRVPRHRPRLRGQRSPASPPTSRSPQAWPAAYQRDAIQTYATAQPWADPDHPAPPARPPRRRRPSLRVRQRAAVRPRPCEASAATPDSLDGPVTLVDEHGVTWTLHTQAPRPPRCSSVGSPRTGRRRSRGATWAASAPGRCSESERRGSRGRGSATSGRGPGGNPRRASLLRRTSSSAAPESPHAATSKTTADRPPQARSGFRVDGT
ncbi:hypothetical protein ACU686_35925 [Yinghuangia aomiensis]